MRAVHRPILRYHGGKWRIAPWIIENFPPHKVYVEPFGGAASTLLRKNRSYSEVYNDLDSDVVNLFRIVRDYGKELRDLLLQTPFAREEFFKSYEITDKPLEQARRTVVRSFMGFRSSAVSGELTGFRSNSNRSGTTPAHDWANYPIALDALIERLQGVVIENRDAVDVMRNHDSDQTLHYVDPPYVPETRGRVRGYRHEMSEEEHKSLARLLNTLKGAVVLSGYRCDLYDELYSKWERIDRIAYADGAQKRVESLWISPNTPPRNLPLFSYG